MKKPILISILLGSFLSASAQRVICPTTFLKYKNSGLWAAEVFGGPKDWTGWMAGGGLVYFLPRFKAPEKVKYLFPNKFVRLNAFYSRDHLRQVRHEASGLDLILGFTPFNVSDVIYGSVLVGGTYSSDKLADNSNPAISSKLSKELTVYKPGALFGVEVSAFLSRNGTLSVVGAFTQRSLANDKQWGLWRWYATLGLRYHFIAIRPLDGAKQKSQRTKYEGNRP